MNEQQATHLHPSDSQQKNRSTERTAGTLVATAILVLAGFFWVPIGHADEMEGSCDTSIRIGGSLPLPCTLPLADYEQVLYTWVNDFEYMHLGWVRDKHVRDTGPFVLGANYGTHPAVRIYYSPEVSSWLEGGRQGDLPNGSMIIKEMFDPPAARWEEQRPEDCDSGCEVYDNLLRQNIGSWTIMIKDSQTRDGWFWSGPSRVSPDGKTRAEFELAIAATRDTDNYPFEFRDSDHGQASCLRCHSTSEGEFTFSSLENIEGNELRFRVDNSWRTDLAPQQRPAAGDDEALLLRNAYHGNSSAVVQTPDDKDLVEDPLPSPNPEFVQYFELGGSRPPMAASRVRSFPGQWADHVPAGPDGAEQFITSDNCIGCHGGLGGAPSGVNMFLQTGSDYGDGYNVSPFGEWRWSPMGLAGRDPAFFSQLASELAILDNDFKKYPNRFDRKRKNLEAAKNAVVNTCLSCHGAMGQRQLLIDAVDDKTLDPNFRRDYVYLSTALTEAEKSQPHYAYHKYGNLAREGISCAVCHHIDPAEPVPGEDWNELETFLMTSTTGQFPYSPRDQLNGPFDDVQELPMERALGITPEANAYIRDSKMCGTCHTINLPNVDSTDFDFPELDKSARLQAERLKKDYGVDYAEVLTQFPHSIEQATFLEWQNSDFATDEASFQSCQDCHMPNSFHSLDQSIAIDPLVSQIASIQDSSYPEAEHSLPDEDLEIPFRSDYRRHEMVGLNVFLLEMFDQFESILGVAEGDYMTGANTGNRLAIENMVRQGQNDTVELGVDIVSVANGQLTADVTVSNLVGHRFPSGVGFRRTWLEVLVLDNSHGGEVVWASGRTNSVGMIVDGLSNAPLATEFFADNRGQPHYHGIPDPDGSGISDPECKVAPPPVTRQDQVQIYEEIVLDKEGQVNFSFIHRDTHQKDNRLLPRGWKASDDFEGEILQEFMEATDPKGVCGDPDYDPVPGFQGVDHVRYIATLPPEVDSTDLTVQVSIYYQAFQPYWMKQRFELSGDSPDTQRLYYLASHLNTKGTIIESWKLPLVTASATTP